jgi:hypothetical protein
MYASVSIIMSNVEPTSPVDLAESLQGGGADVT